MGPRSPGSYCSSSLASSPLWMIHRRLRPCVNFPQGKGSERSTRAQPGKEDMVCSVGGIGGEACPGIRRGPQGVLGEREALCPAGWGWATGGSPDLWLVSAEGSQGLCNLLRCLQRSGGCG